MLSRREIQASVDRAKVYPPGHGMSFFCDRSVRRYDTAARRLIDEPGCEQFG